LAGKRMTRLAEAESLRRIKNAARTTGEFQELCDWYDKLDGNRERRERYNEIRQAEYRVGYVGSKQKGYKLLFAETEQEDDFADDVKEGNNDKTDNPDKTVQDDKKKKQSQKKEKVKNQVYDEGAIIPPPLCHPYWRELMRGDFINTIFDNPDEIWQILGDWQVGRLVKALTAKQRDVLFRSAVRLCPCERIAICTDKTPRGVNKLLAATLKYIRPILAEQIRKRLDEDLPVTLEKRRFLELYDKQIETPDKAPG